MGVVADAVLGGGGKAHGVITRALLDREVASGFVHPAHRDMVLIDSDPARLLDRLAAWTPVTVPKWLDRAQR